MSEKSMLNFIKCLFGMDLSRQPYIVFQWINEPYYIEDVYKHPFLKLCEGPAPCRYRQQIRPVLVRANFLTTQISVVLLKCSFLIVLMSFISILLKGFFSFFFFKSTYIWKYSFHCLWCFQSGFSIRLFSICFIEQTGGLLVLFSPIL